MRFKDPQKYLATQSSVIKALKFNLLQLLAFYSGSKTVEVSLFYIRMMELLCALEVVWMELHQHVDMDSLAASTNVGTTGKHLAAT